MKQTLTLLMLVPLLLAHALYAQHPGRWYQRGQQADDHQSYGQAVHFYTMAIRMGYHPLPKAYMARATAQARQGDLRAALRDYDRVIEMEPRHAKAYANRGNTWLQLGRPAEALVDIREAMDLGLHDANIYYLRGRAYLQLEEYHLALEDFERALTRDPAHEGAWNERQRLASAHDAPSRTSWNDHYPTAYEEGEIRNGNRRGGGTTVYEPRRSPQPPLPDLPDKPYPTREELEREDEPAPPSSPAWAELDDLQLDRALPRTRMHQPDAIALLIGNQQYEHAPELAVASQDVQLVKRYLIEALGYKEGNIFVLENATTSDFQIYFGTRDRHEGRLFHAVKEGKSDLLIYYSGHGVPDLQGETRYFLPVNCDPAYVELGGYSLDVFYENIAKIPARSKTVLLDACFSGVDIYQNLSLARIKPKPRQVSDPSLAVFTASTADQAASWYKAKGHGLFTWFFLRALSDYTMTDADRDGELSLEEIHRFISDKTEGVPYYARRLHGIEQNPLLLTRDPSRTFMRY